MSDATSGFDSSHATPAIDAARWQGLPEWLRPRDQEQRGSGNLRLVTTTILVFVGLLLAVATVNDVGREVNVNQRLTADLRTWRSLTGHNYKNLTIEQNIDGRGTREVVCGNTKPGAPQTNPQLCLIITGPVVHGLRRSLGGYYLQPYVIDQRRHRYACFGTAKRPTLCPR